MIGHQGTIFTSAKISRHIDEPLNFFHGGFVSELLYNNPVAIGNVLQSERICIEYMWGMCRKNIPPPPKKKKGLLGRALPIILLIGQRLETCYLQPLQIQNYNIANVISQEEAFFWYDDKYLKRCVFVVHVSGMHALNNHRKTRSISRKQMLYFYKHTNNTSVWGI